jgi:ABC-2 type transport system permease protein
MRKYWQIFKLSLQDYFVYRTNFVLWRLRSFIFFLTLIFFWQAVFSGRESLFGYGQNQMIAYVLGIAFLKALVLGSRSFDELPGMIKDGQLTKFMLKPVSISKYLFSRDLLAKLLDVSFSLVEIFLVVRLLNLDFYFPQNVSTYFIFALISVLSVVLYYFIGIFVSSFAFWFEEVWATRWLFGIIFLEFLSGVYFPIDVLPKGLVRIINLTPFPYLVYYPLKVWNETSGILEKSPLQIVLIMTFWVVVIYVFSGIIWKKGLKQYSAYGG